MRKIPIIMMLFVLAACGSSDNNQISTSTDTGKWDDPQSTWDNAVFGN